MPTLSVANSLFNRPFWKALSKYYLNTYYLIKESYFITSKKAGALCHDDDILNVGTMKINKWRKTNPCRQSMDKTKQCANRVVSVQGDFIGGDCQVHLSRQTLLV